MREGEGRGTKLHTVTDTFRIYSYFQNRDEKTPDDTLLLQKKQNTGHNLADPQSPHPDKIMYIHMKPFNPLLFPTHITTSPRRPVATPHSPSPKVL